MADESCAMLTFGGLLAALLYAKNTGIGQKVETSLVGSIFRLMGWTMTTTMWRDKNPITGARVTGTRQYPGIAASFNDRDGKPFVFQLDHRAWKEAMEALGFWGALEERGASDLGLAVESEESKDLILATLAELFATADRDTWVAAIRSGGFVAGPINTLLEASNDPNMIANGYVAEKEYPELGETVKVHGSPWQFSETPAKIGVAPKLGEHNTEVYGALGYDAAEIAALVERGVI